jgi:hypothetical protein
MKKYKFILFSIISILILFPACEEALDFQNDGRITMDQVFKDRRKIQGYLNSCYNYDVKPPIARASYSDEAEDSDVNNPDSKFSGWYAGAATASTFGSYAFDNPWGNLYQGIRKCNIFLENIPTADAYGIEDTKIGWEAQARTLRALYYLQLIKRYGGVPLIKEPVETTHDYSADERASFSEVVQFILDECDKALEAPATESGFPWEIFENQYGIMTRAVAYAIKSQAVTYAASPLWSDGTFTWEDATAINKEALAQCLTHDYELFDLQPSADAAQNAYADYFIRTSNDRRAADKETIYRGARMSIWRLAGLPTNPGVEKAGPSPSQELIDSYEMANGMPPILGYSDENHLNPVINTESGYDPNNPYENRDPRFYASIYYNGAVRNLDDPGGKKIETFAGGEEQLSETDRKYTKTGYYIRKFNNYKSGINNESDGENRIFRLAELYLNFAESAYQSHGPDDQIDLGAGISMSARDAVNAIRERADMPPLPSGLSVQDFEKRYRNERRVELAFEGHRFFDVRRWKILNVTDNFVTGMRIMKDGEEYTYERFKLTDRQVYSDKYLIYPIPEDEVLKILELTGENWQNSGW